VCKSYLAASGCSRTERGVHRVIGTRDRSTLAAYDVGGGLYCPQCGQMLVHVSLSHELLICLLGLTDRHATLAIFVLALFAVMSFCHNNSMPGYSYFGSTLTSSCMPLLMSVTAHHGLGQACRLTCTVVGKHLQAH
jgi:hypothetical protein